MRDAARSNDTFPESIRKALMQNNSRMHNILIIIILLSLTALAGYLAYDILFNRSVGASDHSSSLIGKGNAAVMDTWQDKGMKLFEQGKYNEAIESFNKAISENSSNPLVWMYKGKALYALGDDESAIKCFDKALTLRSSDGEALYMKGRALLDLNRSDEARDAFAKAEKLGNWPNPMRSTNSSNKTAVKSDAKSGSSTSKGENRIIVDWNLANSHGHSSSSYSSDDSVASSKASTSTKAVSPVGAGETNKNTPSTNSKENVTYNNFTKNNTNEENITAENITAENITAENITAENITAENPMVDNTTVENAAEISDNLTENYSTGIPQRAPIVDKAVVNKPKKIETMLSARAARLPEQKEKPQERKAQMEAKRAIKSPKIPTESEANDQGAQIDPATSANGTNTEKTPTMRTAVKKNASSLFKPKVAALKPKETKKPAKKSET